jgi:hypothetical protein
MSRLTSIELADDGGTLIGASVRGTTVTVNAIERFNRRASPGSGGFTRALQQAKAMHDLPSRARVVLWDGRVDAEPALSPAIEPITAAGFQVERVVSPCDALAALARTQRPRSEATLLWLAVNVSHVAIVAIRPGRLFYWRAFAWDSSAGAIGRHAKLLQRYSLVAFLAPEVRRAMRAAAADGGHVNGIVTCGDFPDLRSLTMPLIEELDVEVETLDSTQGINVDAPLHASIDGVAPAIRLAVAGVVARPPRPRKSWFSVHAAPLSGAAAVAALAAGAAWYGHRSQPAALPPPIAAAGLPRTDVILPAPPVAPAAPAAVVETPAPAPLRPVPPPPAAAKASPETANAPPSSVLTSGPDLPRVTGILTSDERRIALIDGKIIRVGDTVGRWRVTAIEPRSVVFLDPSGIELKVPLR